MCPHVPLQLVGVSAGVAAKAALEGPFPCVGPDVSFQLAHLKRAIVRNPATGASRKSPAECHERQTAYLHAAVVAHRALEGLLVRVFVAAMAHQLATGHKCHVAVCALVWPGA